MKYQLEIELDLPRSKVIELLDNTDNMPKWQPGLISWELLSGASGEVGAKTHLKYQMGKREIEMTETITERNLPDVFSGTYEAKGVFNAVVNHFEEISPTKTRWIAVNEFQCSGMMRVMSSLMPGVFKKETFKYMQNFKTFAEENSNNG